MDVLGAVALDADGAGVVVVSGAFWVAGTEVVGVCDGEEVGVVVVELGDCANAAVAKTRPTAVLIRKRVFILSCSLCGLHERTDGLMVPTGTCGNRQMKKGIDFLIGFFRCCVT